MALLTKMYTDKKLLLSAYESYLDHIEFIEPCVRYMPYGWLKLPDGGTLDSPLGLQQLIFCQVADEAARELANQINHLINQVKKLEAWSLTLKKYEKKVQYHILMEFVRDAATMAILCPYTIKARFFYTSAHLSHQANAAKWPEVWSDSFELLPDDSKIVERVASDLAKGWKSWRKLIAALNTLDGSEFKQATDDFRNKYTHRLPPQVEIGISQQVRRLKSGRRSAPSYAVGGSQPVKLESLVPALSVQCKHSAKCYQYFQALVNEQGSALFTQDPR